MHVLLHCSAEPILHGSCGHCDGEAVGYRAVSQLLLANAGLDDTIDSDVSGATLATATAVSLDDPARD